VTRALGKFDAAGGWGMMLYRPRFGTMTLLLSTLFWDKKLKIGVLTLATFAALC
jgi:hypothetical protein